MKFETAIDYGGGPGTFGRFTVGAPPDYDSLVQGWVGDGRELAEHLEGEPGEYDIADRVRRLRNVAYIEEIHVAEGARQKGMGTALMGEALKFLGGLGATKVYLTVSPHRSDQAVLIRFYERFGFRVDPTIEERWPVMALDLPNGR